MHLGSTSYHIWEYFETLSRKTADATAISSPEGSITFAGLLDAAGKLADALRKQGIKSSDLVCHTMTNCIDFVTVFLALCKIPAVVTLVSPLYQKQELESIINNLQPACFITNNLSRAFQNQDLFESRVLLTPADYPGKALSILVPKFASSSSRVGVERADSYESLLNATALMKLTSGSTGQPKAVALSDKNILSESRNIVETLEVTCDDRILAAVPLSHSYGFDLGILAMLASGAGLVIRENFIPRSILRDLTDERISIFLGVPSMYRFLLETRLDSVPNLSHIRYFLSCTAPLRVEMIHAFHSRFGAPICQHYGSSETGAASNHVPAEIIKRPDSVGKAMKNVEIRIVGPRGESMACGSEGEVAVSGDNVAIGYLMGSPEGKNPLADGTYLTGDIGFLDKDGFLYLKGRADHIINVGGLKVAPEEVAMILEENPAVREVAVIGVKDSTGEGMVCAAVTLKERATENDLLEFCRGRLAEYKVPRRIVILKEMPRTSSGKIILRAKELGLE